MALPKTVFSIPNLTVSISGSSGKILFIKNELAIDLKDYTIDHYKNIVRFIMLTEDEIKGLKFEQGLKKLEELVTQLDDGNLSLEESISYYEMGIKLKSHCEKLLKTAELKILKVSDKEKLVTEDLRADDNE